MKNPSAMAGTILESCAGKQAADLKKRGADANPPELAGTDDPVLVQLRGLSASAEVVTIDSEPPDPDGTNRVTVVRIP